MFPPNTPPPDPLGLMPPVQRQPMQAPAPPVVAAQDPKQQLLAIATIGAMLGAGPKSGIGTGMGHGVLQGQQELQRLSDLHAQQSFRNEQILQEASRRQADDAADRQRQLQQAVMTITQRVQQIPDKATYDVEIGGYAKALQASGYRLDENWLRQAAPFVAPTAEKQAQRAMEAFTKNPANAELLKTHPDQLAKVLISFDVDGDGTPEQVPLMRVASIAKMPFATDESGQMITYPKGTSLEQKANADGFLSDLIAKAKAEGKDTTDPTLMSELRTQALELSNAEKGTPTDANYMLNGKPIVAVRNRGRLLYRGQDVTDQVTPYVAPKEKADKLTKVEHRGPDGKTVIEWLPDSQLAGRTFEKGVGATTETRLQSATAVNQTGSDIIAKLSDPAYAKAVGPAIGRANTLREFIGNPPPEFAELAGMIESYALANMGVHGMRSAIGAEKVKSLLDGHHTPASIIAAIRGLNGFSEHFLENEGRTAGQTKAAPKKGRFTVVEKGK